MAFELDPCRVHAVSGELLAQGFVREHVMDTLLVEAEHFSGSWLEPGDAAVVEVLSAHKGACTYDATVEFSTAGRIALTDLRLREVVQQRSAVRVPVSLPHRITHRVDGLALEALEEPVDVVVLDVSAHGVRLRCDVEIDPGVRLALRLEATRVPVDLVIEVLRVEALRGEFAYGCRIVGADERTTDELFRFVLDEQRRQLAERAQR